MQYVDDENGDDEVSWRYTLDRIPIRTIFVSNIMIETTEEDLIQSFSFLGWIIRARIIYPLAQSDRNTTYGFVTFRDPVAAARALQLRRRIKLNGKYLFLNTADSWHQPVENPDGRLTFPVRRGQEEEPAESEDEIEEQIEEEASDVVDNSLINQLNDDCLRAVFDHVRTRDHPVLSQVCRRWRSLMFTYWDKVTVLDLTADPLSGISLNDETIRPYFSLCRNIRAVVLTQIGHRISSQSIGTAVACVPDLEELSLINFHLCERPLSLIAHKCSNLRKFTMKACNYGHDNEIIPLIKKCRKLLSIRIERCKFYSGNWLCLLGPPLSSLALTFCDLTASVAARCLDSLSTELNELALTFRHHSDSLELPLLPNLKKLSLGTVELKGPSLLSNMKDLEHLELFRVRVSSISLIPAIVAQNPDLEALNISESFASSHQKFELLTQLHNLHHLNISGLECVNDAILENLGIENWNLISLNLRNCITVTDQGCRRLVTKLPNLRWIDLRGCRRVSAATFHAANSARLADRNKPHLTLMIDVQNEKLQSTSSVTVVHLSYAKGPMVWNAVDISEVVPLSDEDSDYSGFTDDDIIL